MSKARRAATALLIAGTGVMLAWNAPGQLTYDSIVQLADGRSGHYDSWHPPVMAWLLGLFDALVPGTLLFLIFQALLLLAALVILLHLRQRNGWTVLVTLLIVVTPQWLLYQGEIWKDVLFSAAAIGGFCALAAFARDAKKPWLLLAALLLTLAAATRQNGVVLLPVAAIALAAIAGRHQKSRWAYGWGFLAITLVATVSINLALAARGDGGTGARAQIRMAQSYDLTGALAHDPSLTLPGLTAADPKLARLLRERGVPLYSSFHVDPLSDDQDLDQAISNSKPGIVSAAWREMILTHPMAYLHHRLAVTDKVLRTPDAFQCHFSPVGIDGPPQVLQSLGLTARIRPQDQALADYARLFFKTPVFFHPAWGALAVVLLVLMWRRREPADLAICGLLAGAGLFAASFAVIAIACDYRYILFLDLTAMAAALHLTGPREPAPT